MSNMSNAVEFLSYEIRDLTKQLENRERELKEEWVKNQQLEEKLSVTTRVLNSQTDESESLYDELECLKNELNRTKRGREILARHNGK